MALPQESNSLCLKRKLVDDCLSKECKSRRVQANNGLSSDSSAEHCNRAHPNLAIDCVNFLKSGVPSRIMYYKQGSWHNFSEQIMKALIEEFKGNKSSVVVVMDNEPFLVDFLSMTLVNLGNRNQRSVAWFDGTCKRFFPSKFFDEETSDVVKGDAVNVESTAPGIMLDKVANSPHKMVKQVVQESCPPDPQKSCNIDTLHKKITYVKRDNKDFLFVQDLFLSGMGPFASPKNLLHVYRYSPNDITGLCRLEAFERQMKFTKEHGDANVRYGWLGCRKNDIVRILIDGLDTTGKPIGKSGLNAGIYLSPENRAFASVGLCDDDEKGVQYMFLCRVILGNMEAIKLGSQESFPGSKMYDSGVDDCLNPKCYMMGLPHLSTHIRFEYLISFKLAPVFRNYLLGLWFHSLPKQVPVDITVKPVICETGQGPTTPWVSFKILLGVIQDKISPVARELLFHHYEEFKQSKITREEMVKMMMIIVGEGMLLGALKKLQQSPSPSLLGKPSVEASNDSTRTATEQLSLDKAHMNCVIAPSGNHDDDSRAPNAIAEHSTVPGFAADSDSCESIILSLASGHSESRGMERRNSKPRMTIEGQEFISLGIASQSPVHSLKGPDVVKPAPLSPVLAPERGNSPLISSCGCNSSSPSLMPKGHDPPATSKEPKCRESSTADRVAQSYHHSCTKNFGAK